MQKCNYCGRENVHGSIVCQECGTPLGGSVQTRMSRPEEPVLSPIEIKFWERMTFRQFAILMIRLQAISFLAGAVIQLTYLPRYFELLRASVPNTTAHSDLKLDLFLMSIRIVINVAATLLLIQQAERILSWLASDMIASQVAPLGMPERPEAASDVTPKTDV